MLENMYKDEAAGDEIYQLAAELFPIFRSLTGPGVRESLELLRKSIPLEIKAVASGTEVLDWIVPKEWVFREAWIKDPSGKTIINSRENNLHVVGYSAPIHRTLALSELKRFLFSDPAHPDVIPYRTAYYADTWGFCLSQNARDGLVEGEYEVMIDSSLVEGELNYGELFHKGMSNEEIVLTTHCCHPSMANDNCSGMAMLAFLAKQILQIETRYSYRFLWIPGTIGAISWLAANEDRLDRIRQGLVLAGVGDAGGPTYKCTRRGDAPLDKAMCHLLSHREDKSDILTFFPYGYDERQFNSPGFKLDFGLVQRSQFATYPQYHTSADNLDFIAPEYLGKSYNLISDAIEIFEKDARYVNVVSKGEPQLGRRGLYDAIGGSQDSYDARMAMLWLLNLCDGEHSLLDIADRAEIEFCTIARTADLLRSKGLLVEAGSIP
jgi:aminopeptidase-like protein